MIKTINFGTRTIKDFDLLCSELNKIDKKSWVFASPARNESGDTLIDVDENSKFYLKFIKLKFSINFP